MEEDIDIYADLPSFDLKVDNNEKQIVCNCEELRKELSTLKSEHENIQHVNKNLEKNIASLLKTAKLEIARKDRTIGDLRKQLDDMAFRRKNHAFQQNSCIRGSSYQQDLIVEKHENVVSSTHPDDDKFIPHQNEIYDEEDESKKLQNDTDRIPNTVFSKRLYKKIIDEEKEEKRQKALLMLSVEANTRKNSKETVAESDKENGTQSTINNINEFNAAMWNSNLEASCERNVGKWPNDGDDTCRSKRRKTEVNDDKTTSNDIDYNYIVQYDVKSNLVQSDDQLYAMRSIKKGQVHIEPLSAKHRDLSDDTMKQDRNTNKCKREARSSSGRDYDVSRTRGESADNLRNSWAVSKSNERPDNHHDYYINDYKKKSYRCNSPSFRSYSRSRSRSRSRSDYESWSNRPSEIRGRTHKDRKYEDYKYYNRYRNDKFGRDYSRNEHDNNRRRYNNRERSDSRDRLKHPLNDDREMRNNCKDNKYNSHKMKVSTEPNIKEIKEASLVQTNSKSTNCEVITKLKSSSKNTMANEIHNYNDYNMYKIKTENSAHVSNDTKLHKSNKTAVEVDFVALSNQLVVHKKKESCNGTPINLTENTPVNTITMDNLEELEQGEILDSPTVSPEKKNHFTDITENKVTEVKVSAESKNRGAVANTANYNELVIPQNDTVSTKQLEKTANINDKEMKEATLFLRVNSEGTDHDTGTQLNFFSRNNVTVNEVRDRNNHNGVPKSHSDGNSADSAAQNIQTTLVMIERARDGNVEGENCIDSTKEDFTNSPIENVAMIEEVNNSNIDNICKTDDEALTVSIATEIEVVPNCDANKDSTERSRMSIENDTPQTSNESNAEANRSCLNDHNYVRCVTTDFDIVQKPSVKLECKTVPEEAEITTSMETRTKETISVQSPSIKKTTPSTSKNKKEQLSKPIIILRRRKAVMLSDNKASMTMLMNTDTANASSVVKSSINDNDSVSKPRACKHTRICKGGL